MQMLPKARAETSGERWLEDGYAVVKAVFTADEIAELAAAFDRIWQEGLRHPSSFRHGNVFYRIAHDAAVGRVVRYMQWPAYIDPVLDRFRQDPRMLAIVAPLLGADLKQIINQMHWKPPGAAMTEFGYHQDIRFRRPRSAYRDPASSYLQTGIAIDVHRRENGAMLVYPGSHRLGELDLGEGRVMDRPLDDEDLIRAGLDPAVGARPRPRSGRRRAVAPAYRPWLRAQRVRRRPPVLHQRLRPGVDVRPRRMDVPRRPPGGTGRTGAGPLRGPPGPPGSALRRQLGDHSRRTPT